ncbi:Heterokaryon incompatibility protein 6 OR allele [Colletotrichum asianum]
MSEAIPENVQPRSRLTTNIPDTSLATPRDKASGDTVYSTSQNYERLRPGEIRLLCLLPRESAMELVTGYLATFMQGATPKYTAISYAWGDGRRISTIQIDGKATPVTNSLWHALVALTKHDEPVWIWADALSINQCDVDELNSQVHIMDKIYSEAHTVAICLGSSSESDDIRLAFELLKGATAWESANTPQATITGDQRRMSSVVRLFERNYWKRLWIVQEVFHAKRADVYCGSDCIPLQTIFSACTAFQTFSDDIEKFFPAGKQDLKIRFSVF